MIDDTKDKERARNKGPSEAKKSIKSKSEIGSGRTSDPSISKAPRSTFTKDWFNSIISYGFGEILAEIAGWLLYGDEWTDLQTGESAEKHTTQSI